MVYYHFDLGGPICEMHWTIQLVLNVIITVTVGIGYFELENYIRKRITERKAMA
jgi:hypothetical protein